MAERVAGDHAAVVRIGDVDAAQEFGAGIGAAVAVGVIQHQEPRLGGDDYATLVEGHAVESIETVGEDRGLIRLAVVIGVFEHKDFIVRLLARNGVRKRRHGDHPEAAAGVEAQLHRIAELGKLLLGGEEIHGVAVGYDQLVLHVGGRANRASGKPIRRRLARGHRWKGRRGIIRETLRRVCGEVVDDGVGLGDELVIAREFGGIFLGTFADAVVERGVLGANEFGHVAVFLSGGARDVSEPGGSGCGGRGVAEERACEGVGDRASAGGVEMDTLCRERLGAASVGIATGGEEIDEGGSLRAREVRDGLGVEGDVAVSLGGVGRAALLDGDG